MSSYLDVGAWSKDVDEGSEVGERRTVVVDVSGTHSAS